MSDERDENSDQGDFQVVNHRNEKTLKKLKGLREEVDWEKEEKRYDFLKRLYPLFYNWKGQLPNLRDIFRPEEIERILSDCINCRDRGVRKIFIVKFVARSGYKDEPKVEEDGKPSSRRATPLHLAARQLRCGYNLVPDLFQIYDRFDVNYTDEFGFTHFHAACATGIAEVVEKFLELGQDPNCLVTETGDSPLHSALLCTNLEVAEMLLKHGADPNAPNKEGRTPLHVICRTRHHRDSVKMLFELGADKYQPVRIDAQDESGNAPLHLALDVHRSEIPELLLRHGADPNLANAEGSTPLHIICKRYHENDLAKLFFGINDEKHQLVKVDARDSLGRTPLQWAVAHGLPDVVDLLLDRGADLSSFVFPTESYFAYKRESLPHAVWLKNQLLLMFGALTVVERLEKRGYELDRNAALTIMKFFAKYGSFKMSTDPENHWYDDEKFAIKAKKTMMRPGLSLYDLTRLRFEEAEKLLACSDYFKFANAYDSVIFSEGPSEACAKHLCELMTRRFFHRWAMEFFLELTRYELPILCCEIIIDKLMNRDLCCICLAAAGQSL